MIAGVGHPQRVAIDRHALRRAEADRPHLAIVAPWRAVAKHALDATGQVRLDDAMVTCVGDEQP